MSKLVPFLARSTGLSEYDVLRIIATAPARYKKFTIQKRGGGRRQIAHPSVELKALQRCVATHYLEGLPIHPSATAYETGASIKKNARIHVGNGPILKLDFRNFFPSIVPSDWETYCDRHEIMSRSDAELCSNILFYRPTKKSALRLAIGAPSSPKLSNLLMFDFDSYVSAAVASDSVKYTRYADDLTFSAPRLGHLRDVKKIVKKYLNEMTSPKLHLNSTKSITVTNKFRRQVTGLILTQDGDVSLGRDRKRYIRSKVHHYTLGNLTQNEIKKLHGILSFAYDVERAFVARLEARYGEGILLNIKNVVLAMPLNQEEAD